MKKKLLRYGIGFAVGGLIAIWVMYLEGLFDAVNYPRETVIMILCDAFFVSGILLALFGALLWIATTGFFDSLGYACRVAVHLIIPMWQREHKTFYDYKVEKESKRGTPQVVPVVVGAVYLLVSAVFLILWSRIS